MAGQVNLITVNSVASRPFLFYLKSVRGMKVRILIFKLGFNIASNGER